MRDSINGVAHIEALQNETFVELGTCEDTPEAIAQALPHFIQDGEYAILRTEWGRRIVSVCKNENTTQQPIDETN